MCNFFVWNFFPDHAKQLVHRESHISDPSVSIELMAVLITVQSTLKYYAHKVSPENFRSFRTNLDLWCEKRARDQITVHTASRGLLLTKTRRNVSGDHPAIIAHP